MLCVERARFPALDGENSSRTRMQRPSTEMYFPWMARLIVDTLTPSNAATSFCRSGFLAADKIRGLLLRSNQQNLLQQGVPIKQPALQSACLIGALAQELANLRVIGIGKETGIRLVDRQRTAVDKLHVKTVFAVYEIGIRDDILWIVVGKAVGRSRIEISNQSKCLFGLFLRHVKETCQHTGARPAQKQLPVHTDNSFWPAHCAGKTPELQQEAFLQAASADSGRLQRLNRLQRIFYRRLAHAKFTRC